MLQAVVLVELSRTATTEMYGSDLDAFFDQFGDDLIPRSDKEEVLQGLIDEGEIDVVLEGGRNDGFLIGQNHKSPYHERYGITDAGFTKIHVSERDRSGRIYQYMRFGNEWLTRKLEEIYCDVQDGALEILPTAPDMTLDFRSNPHFQKLLLEKLDALISAVNTSNEFRAADQAKFEAVSGALNALQAEIGAGTTKAGRLEKTGLGALEFLAKKFAETVIGILATDFWATLVNVVKSIL